MRKVTVFSLSGIGTKVFSAHSYRGTWLSFAYNKGVSLNDILKVGDSFSNHYYAHASNTSVDQIILN